MHDLVLWWPLLHANIVFSGGAGRCIQPEIDTHSLITDLTSENDHGQFSEKCCWTVRLGSR